MIRILHSVSNMDRAGIETMLMNYYRHMDREQIQFDFLCNKQKPGAYDDEIRKMGGKIYHTPGLNPIKYPKYVEYMRKLFHDHPEYRIVEAHNGALGVYALNSAKRCNIPVRIFHAHGASITKDWKMPIKLVCKSRLKSNTTQNYSCGIEAARYYFGDEVIKENEYELIPNAIEVNRFIYNYNIRKKLRNKYQLNDKHVIGHVGRFMTQKNHEFLLDIFNEVYRRDSNSFLVLLGDGELMTNVKEKVKRLNLEKNVLFMGNVQNVNEWYQAFDLFLLPSMWEGLPVVGIEAQTADLPCVFSNGVPAETKITENVKFLDLKDSVQKWGDIIVKDLCENKHERTCNEKVITERGYNIDIEAIKLQKRYLKLYGE